MAVLRRFASDRQCGRAHGHTVALAYRDFHRCGWDGWAEVMPAYLFRPARRPGYEVTMHTQLEFGLPAFRTSEAPDLPQALFVLGIVRVGVRAW